MTRRLSDLEGNDPYVLLDISPGATTDDIQRAYRRVMREAHPDLATGDEGRTKLLNIARDVLLDPDLRAEVDRRALGTKPETVLIPYRQPTDDRSTYTRPDFRPAPGGGIGLGVWALIATLLCSPLGAVLGVVALMRNPKPQGANKVCAVIAVCLGAVVFLCCVGYLGFAIFGSSLTTASGT